MKISEFTKRNEKILKQMAKDIEFKKISYKWFLHSLKHEYSYHFEWLGLPIIQYPQDIIAYQEIIWNIKPGCCGDKFLAGSWSVVRLVFDQRFHSMVGPPVVTPE